VLNYDNSFEEYTTDSKYNKRGTAWLSDKKVLLYFRLQYFNTPYRESSMRSNWI
jgi:hypothetical protein